MYYTDIKYINIKHTPIHNSTYAQPEDEFRQVYWCYQIVLF